MTDGIITKGIGGFYYVSTPHGSYQCRARGKLRQDKIIPVVGDRVKISIVNESQAEGVIEQIQPRVNYLIRPPVANVDTVVIVIASASPCPDYYMVDKLIVTAEKAGIEIIIAVNKTDLASPDAIIDIYKKSGFVTVKTCAEKNLGIDNLKALLTGKITAFAGNSGVGKSSLLNRFGFSLETGDVSKIERGRHTTRHVELLPLGKEGYVIDTPGFSLLDIYDIEPNHLKDYFREFESFSRCRFKDCTHIDATSGNCAVVSAVEKGDICPTRYSSYLNLYKSLKDIKN